MGTKGMGRGNPWAAPDKMSVIMNPELRIGAVLLARAARAGWEIIGEGEERGGESCCCLTDACNELCCCCSMIFSIPLQQPLLL